MIFERPKTTDVIKNKINQLLNKSVNSQLIGDVKIGSYLSSGLDSTKITAIGEVNDEKVGKFTPSTNIPILYEDKVLDMGDLFIVLPWHFKDFFLSNQKFKGRQLLFPLPYCHIVSL